MSHCNEHLQEKLYRLKFTVCDSACHTADSTMSFFFPFKFYFVLFGYGLQGQGVDMKGWDNEWDQNA